MRYIDINLVLTRIPPDVVRNLKNEHQALVSGDEQAKKTVIDNGSTIWRNVKASLEAASHRKCWYTESENAGFPNDVDHFRPKAKILDCRGQIEQWYWFLAFDPENYRLSCQFSNRLNANPISGLTGGKGDKFPLLHGQVHATSKPEIAVENPVLLDPCNQADCDLLSFQADGRPVVSPKYLTDSDSCYRVKLSTLLLNLDYPTFNEGREALYNTIKDLVKRGDNYGAGNPALEDVKRDLRKLIEEISPYSKAAECYIRFFRDREWIEQLLFS